jgi:uncharacterized cupin superfamily protein
MPHMVDEPVVVDTANVPESNATTYPAPFRDLAARRWNRRLGRILGLTNFGVTITRIEPGGQSSCRHWHARQDEFVYVLSGEAILETDAGEHRLTVGMCAGFPAGLRNGHRFVNRGETDVILLVAGDNTPGETVHYPDVDMHLTVAPDGSYAYTRKDGTPFD